MSTDTVDGITLAPPRFRDGLGVWSSGDGRPGSDTYAGSGQGTFVPADSQFGGCLEVIKTSSLARVRYMGVTPIRSGRYWRVKLRVKAVSGAFPTVRIAGTPLSGSNVISGVTTQGPAVTLSAYGTPVEVSAVIGTGARPGVDLVWAKADGAHIGLDITGANGALLRIDDFEVEEVTTAYLQEMVGLVDVRDYGAVGDGVTDDSAAFEAADRAANGREVLISAGRFRLNKNVIFQSQVRIAGKVTMPQDKHLIFQRNFDYDTYADAFDTEEEAFKRGFQALLNYSDHYSLDLCGRRIALSAPVNMANVVGNKTRFESRRMIRNGELHAIPGPGWKTGTASSQGTYNPSNPLVLTGVTNVANIEVGSLVEGQGVGREVYVRDRDVSAQRLTLSQPLYDAEGTQSYSFKRFRYMMDFSGFSKFSNFVFDDMHLSCGGIASGIMLADTGFAFQLKDSQVSRPKDRVITSKGRACQDLLIDRCQFLSNEMSSPVQNRKTLVFNANANDVKIRDSRIVRFKHFCVLAGDGSVVTGNHWFHGDDEKDGIRLGGLILTRTSVRSMITGNYIDNNFIEWTNEHEAEPEMADQFSFGGLTVTGNTFVNIDVVDWFRWIVIKPYGPGHFIHGLSVTGNVFRSLNGRITRIEGVDSSIAPLRADSMRNVVFRDNVFHNIDIETSNPLIVEHNQSSAQGTWTLDTKNRLPFGGHARNIDAVVPKGMLRTGSGSLAHAMPAVQLSQGSSRDKVNLIWPTATRGTVRCTVRMDTTD